MPGLVGRLAFVAWIATGSGAVVTGGMSVCIGTVVWVSGEDTDSCFKPLFAFIFIRLGGTFTIPTRCDARRASLSLFSSPGMFTTPTT